MVITSILSMVGLSVLFASILAIADKKLKVKENPKIEELVNALPSVNCAACGEPSCQAFAVAVIEKGADPDGCRVATEEQREKIFSVVGKEVSGEKFPYIPIIHCAAGWDHKKMKAKYSGAEICTTADIVFSGAMECEYGCLGYGDCCDACEFDALHMINGIPILSIDKCTGCTMCVPACPKDLIEMQEKHEKKLTYVACNSHDDLKTTKQKCDVGCIACNVCGKLSKGEDLFVVKDNLAIADYVHQEDQEKFDFIATKCPTKVIKAAV